MSAIKNQVEKDKYQEYNDFIQQIEIADIRLISAKVDNYGYVILPQSNKISYSSTAWYENREDFIDVFDKYNVTVRDTENRKRIAKLTVTFCVTYISKIPMKEDIFDIFIDRNLPLNTWPYFREFTHESFARMGWLGIVAPTFKR
ncbi:hypothetical protein ACFLXY_03380 [Chloroflexota bacterium]